MHYFDTLISNVFVVYVLLMFEITCFRKHFKGPTNCLFTRSETKIKTPKQKQLYSQRLVCKNLRKQEFLN